ncbi:hypothetical protein D3C71_2100450 [compost metagenome]
MAPRSGRMLTPAGAINHTDEELEFLAKLVDQRTAWQIAGRKGSKDGSGQITYPAAPGGSGGSAPAAPASGSTSRARPSLPYCSDY